MELSLLKAVQVVTGRHMFSPWSLPQLYVQAAGTFQYYEPIQTPLISADADISVR